MNKRIIGLLLCLALLAGLVLPVLAADPAQEPETQPEVTVLRIATEEAFLRFAESCRLDSYSRNLHVILENNLDLRKIPFSAIPIFSGTFDGQNHRISGLDLTEEGDTQGLFRFLTQTAVVKNLSVQGRVQPDGASQVGGIAGSNSGQIIDCSFIGTVSGTAQVGGIAGSNAVSGVIQSCRVRGEVYGDHFVGGVAGANSGVINRCHNYAAVNTTPQENSVDLEDITLETITSSENAITATNIGGIAGHSSGVIRDCINRADVGYRHMGYNIGGIAGTQTGYIADCSNYGSISGRKEVGGIVGQMEPANLIIYTEDTLQILEGQLNTMSGLVNQAAANAQGEAANVTGQIGTLRDQTQSARDAVDILLGITDGNIPSADQILAAQNTLSTTISAMPGTLQGIFSAAGSLVSSIGQDLKGISGQIDAMAQTIREAPENMTGTVSDVSDQDTPELLTGKVALCANFGNVLGDRNIGGITGAMALENDLDFWEDWESTGQQSMNYKSEIRAVVLGCENSGTVTGKKQNVGGVVGWQSLGLVSASLSYGTVDGTGAERVGGIAGQSLAYIRLCSFKGTVMGKSHTGGIAGTGGVVTDCVALVALEAGSICRGAILGSLEEPPETEGQPIRGNFYLQPKKDPGAIDGISYDTIAQPLTLEEFLALPLLPKQFKSVTVRFLREDGTANTLTLTPGEPLRPENIPAVPEKEGFSGCWEGLSETDTGSILSDLTFRAVYEGFIPTLQTAATYADGLPVLLVEGAFPDGCTLTAEAAEMAVTLEEGQTLLECWQVTLPQQTQAVRLHLPAETDPETLTILQFTGGQWQEVSFQTNGRYAVLTADPNAAALAVVQNAPFPIVPVAIGGGAVVLVLAALLIRKKKKNTPAEE